MCSSHLIEKYPGLRLNKDSWAGFLGALKTSLAAGHSLVEGCILAVKKELLPSESVQCAGPCDDWIAFVKQSTKILENTQVYMDVVAAEPTLNSVSCLYIAMITLAFPKNVIEMLQNSSAINEEYFAIPLERVCCSDKELMVEITSLRAQLFHLTNLVSKEKLI